MKAVGLALKVMNFVTDGFELRAASSRLNHGQVEAFEWVRGGGG